MLVSDTEIQSYTVNKPPHLLQNLSLHLKWGCSFSGHIFLNGVSYVETNFAFDTTIIRLETTDINPLNVPLLVDKNCKCSKF